MHNFQINVLIVAMYILSPAAAPVASAFALSSFVCCSSLHQQFLSSDRKAEHHIGFITLLVEVGFLSRRGRQEEHNSTHFWLMPGHGGAAEGQAPTCYLLRYQAAVGITITDYHY